MARSHFVKTSRKEHTCHRGHLIPKGEGYYWAAPGFRSSKFGKKYACKNHPFRPSQLTNSLRAEPLGAIEDAQDALDGAESFEDLISIQQDLESALDDYVAQRQESLDAWENGNSQLEDLVYTAEEARDTIANWSPNGSESDEPDEDWLEEQHALAKENGDPHDRESLVELYLQERLEEDKDELRDLIDQIEV